MPLPYAARRRNIKKNLGYMIPGFVSRILEVYRLTLSSIYLGYRYSAEPATFRHGDADLPRVPAGELRSKSAGLGGSGNATRSRTVMRLRATFIPIVRTKSVGRGRLSAKTRPASEISPVTSRPTQNLLDHTVLPG